MAKNRKNRNIGPIFVLVILPLLAIGISMYAIYKGVQNYITTSNYFKIKEIQVEGVSDSHFVDMIKEETLGTNIFLLDTKKLSGRFERRFPAFDSVMIARILPSQLRVVARKRIPVAAIKKDLYYLFDIEGVAMSSFSSSEHLDVPLIVGLEDRLPKIRIGTTYLSGILRKALLLAEALHHHASVINKSFGSSFIETKIDVTDPKNFCVFFGEDIQVKVGDKDFESRLALLPAILRSIDRDISNVRYIDMRPKEPVVAMKQAVRK